MSIEESRRRFISAAVSAALSRIAWFGPATAVSVGTASCGGGSGGSSGSVSSQSSPASPPSPSILTISSTNPGALSPVYIATSNLDASAPFSVNLANANGAGSVTLSPIRTTSDGTIVVAMPLHISADTGSSSDLNAKLTLTQGATTTAPVALTIRALPSLASLGVSLGSVSRAFYIHQEISIGQSINAHQALTRLPGISAKTSTLLANLQISLTNTILARNDVDRMVADNTVSISIATAPDGTAVNCNANSLDLQDRVIAQFLMASTNMGAVVPSTGLVARGVAARQATATTLTTMQQIITGISEIGTGVSFLQTQQSLSDPSSTTMDRILSTASTLQTVVSVGSTVVALGAAAAGAPEIALGAAAVATYAAVAGVIIGSASIGNDLYNVGTNVSKAISTYGTPEFAAAENDAVKAFGALASDTVNAGLSAYGIGGIAQSAQGVVGRAWPTVMAGIFETSATDVELAAGALVSSTGNLVLSKALASDPAAAQDSVNQLSALMPAAGVGFGTVTGQVSISNSQGPILSGLTGVVISDGTVTNQFQSMADPNGNYSITLPLGNAGINYRSLTFDAYDPITGTVLATMPLDASALKPKGSIALPPSVGSCTDTDASAPDADDPDCD